MSHNVDLEMLKQRLTRLGVDMAANAPHGVTHTTTTHQARHHSSTDHSSSKQEVAELLERIGHVESGLRTADHLAHAAAARISAHMAKAAGDVPGPELRKTKSPSKPRARKVVTKAKVAGGAVQASAASPPRPLPPVTSALRASVAPGPPRGAMGPHTDLLRGVPSNTPLSTVLHQYKEAEVVWAHEKAQLRRETVEQRRRANKADADVRRMTRMLEHRTLDVKSLKSALKNRDTQLDAAIERIKELETLLVRTQEEGSVRVAAVSSERDDCKALLLATLQRLEAVDEVVHRADVSSTMMQDKMKSLEEERLRALEAAARARAEVADLTESRRKLQWQSKLLEKMSEVQLRHNKRKSDALKKLLSPDQQAAGLGGVDRRSTATSDLDGGAAAAYRELMEEDDSVDAVALHDMMQRAGL